MRSLIRPALFMMARAGLVLSVVGWGAGQLMIPMIGAPVALACVTQDGYLCFVYHDVPTPWFLEVQNGSTREQASYSELFRKPTTTKGVSPNVIGFSFGGLTVRRSTVVFVISFRHYLIVTIFALFYGVLKWVYWKRGKVV